MRKAIALCLAAALGTAGQALAQQHTLPRPFQKRQTALNARANGVQGPANRTQSGRVPAASGQLYSYDFMQQWTPSGFVNMLYDNQGRWISSRTYDLMGAALTLDTMVYNSAGQPAYQGMFDAQDPGKDEARRFIWTGNRLKSVRWQWRNSASGPLYVAERDSMVYANATDSVPIRIEIADRQSPTDPFTDAVSVDSVSLWPGKPVWSYAGLFQGLLESVHFFDYGVIAVQGTPFGRFFASAPSPTQRIVYQQSVDSLGNYAFIQDDYFDKLDMNPNGDVEQITEKAYNNGRWEWVFGDRTDFLYNAQQQTIEEVYSSLSDSVTAEPKQKLVLEVTSTKNRTTGLKVFAPHYANGALTVTGLAGYEGGQMSFVSTTGQVLAIAAVTGSRLEMPVQPLAPGVYLVQVATARGNVSRQLVVE